MLLLNFCDYINIKEEKLKKLKMPFNSSCDAKNTGNFFCCKKMGEELGKLSIQNSNQEIKLVTPFLASQLRD